ncbi:type II secretion system protein GspM [Desulfopila aestuarii]|nr:type II secretion system protein GspM [Desulfopila aestuarii]
MDKVLAQLKSRLGLNNLSDRERLILIGGGLFVLGVVIYQLIISPYLVAHERLQSSLQRKQAELVEIQRLSQEYAKLRVEEGGLKALLQKRDAGFTLFAFLDKQAENAGVKEQIKYMKPSVIEGDNGLNESVVEMRLEGVTLEKLTQFLQVTESDTNVVSVRRLSIQTSARDEGFLDVILQIVTLVEAG